MPGKKINTQKNGRANDLWRERKRAANSTPEQKERQRQYRLNAINNAVIVTDKRANEYNRLLGETNV
jgi:hypothetical protein